MDSPRPDGMTADIESILNGQPAPTAEALMRARYAAYATGNVEFIRDSHVSSHRHEVDLNSVREWSQAADWQGIEVLATEKGGEDDDEGVVEFKAHYQLQGQDLVHHEIAQFQREDGQWRFVDGYEPRQEPFRRTERKVKPNEPCPCGSGKKFKKCCGKPGAVAS